MIKLKFNKSKIIPNKETIVNIFKISIASLFSYYVLSNPFNKLFPQVATYPLFLKIIILVSVSYYFKGLFDTKVNGRDYF